MAAIGFLIICFYVGKEIVKDFIPLHTAGKCGKLNPIWVVLPAAFGIGVLTMGWAVYLVSWGVSSVIKIREPLFLGNVLVLAAVLVWFLILGRKKKRNGQLTVDALRENMSGLIADAKRFRLEAVFFGVLFCFFTWLMFYVFFIKDGILYSGFSVYGDYAPHTAMIRSFSWENNFPTQYPHFGGEDVKYHFMFQFFTGNLEYLGLRLDFAYNLISSLVLVGFLMVLYSLACRIAGGFISGVLALVLFFFRSGLAFFRYVWEHVQAGNLWEALSTNTAFIGYTPNENWGLWNFNVYLNQRHLAFGMLLVCVAVWIYLDWVEAAAAHEEKGGRWLRERFFSAQAWKFRKLETALFTGLILGLCSFWNGAAVIGGLLILFGFAIFADGKLDFAVTALVTVGFSLLQSKIFMYGQAVSPSIYWGFLAENKSVAGVLSYLIQMSGVFFVGAAILLIFLKRKERMVLFSFLFPTIFAFVISLTPDINVNHKYIMISYVFVAIFWAGLLVKLWRSIRILRPAVILLTVCLTITGIYDFVIILRNNGPGHRVTINMESSVTEWLSDNLDTEDLLLTPEYSIHEVTMSGVMMYMGWPYYAWSAGYDTYYRAAQAVNIYTSEDPELVDTCVKKEGITHILFEEGMEFEMHECREDIIKKLYPVVYRSDDTRIRIYEVK